MCTKKDYIKAAKIAKSFKDGIGSKKHHRAVCSAFVEFFFNDNPKFDRTRFLTACGMPVGGMTGIQGS